MVESVTTGRRSKAVSVLLPLFFVSGATALVYQTLWARDLHLLFGTSTFAIATVLAAFMAGLALGGAWMARFADKIKRPLRVYGLLEVVIGAYAVAFPFIIKLVAPVYLWVWTQTEPPPLMFGLIQFLLIGSALLLPTTMMGATLPLLARFATARLGAVGDRVGLLYGVNTAGAVLGTALCGFYLLPVFGLWQTTIITAVANIVLGFAALALDQWAHESTIEEVEEDLDEESEFHPALKTVALAIGFGGFAALIYEVAWTRLLVLLLGASVYAFSVMLLAFLIGIAFGGVIGGPISDKILRRHGQAGVLSALAIVEIAIAMLSFALMYIFGELPFWYVWLFDVFGAEQSAGFVWVVSMLIAGLVMTPPAVLMGVAFPLAVRAVVHSKDKLGGPVGAVYSANTAGSLVGAALAGFLLLPTIGVRNTIIVAGFGNLLAAVVLFLRVQATSSVKWRRMRYVLVGSPVILGLMGYFAPWDPMVMTAGMYKYVSSFENHSREGILNYAVGAYEMKFYEEGISTVVTVAQNVETGSMWLANNGKVDASTNVDMPTQVLVGLYPFQFVDNTDDVLIIGLASGITAGAASMVDTIERLDVVELEPATARAARLFDEYNHQILDDPRLNLITNDGRNHVLLSDEAEYDVIISEPSNPWISGVSNLFTQEFLEIGKSRIKEGGVWAQWVQLYGMDREDLRSLLYTFCQVYPHVVLYTTIVDADLVLVGSETPLDFGPGTVSTFLDRWEGVNEELSTIGIKSRYDLLATFLMDRDGILKMVGEPEVNTDDNMRIEYSAPMNLHLPTSGPNVEMLLENAQIPGGFAETHVDMAKLARAYVGREDMDRGKRAMVMAMTAVTEEFGGVQMTTFGQILGEHAQVQRWKAAITVMEQVVRALEDSEEKKTEYVEFVEEYREWRNAVVEVLEEEAEELEEQLAEQLSGE